MTNENARKLGQGLAKWFTQIKPAGVSSVEANKYLRAGDMAEGTQAAKRALNVYANLFADDPAVVAERCVGAPFLYVENVGNVVAGMVTDTSAWVEPRQVPELFEAEPGTVGYFWKPQRGGYGAILIAAHKPGETGVIGIESLTVGNDKLNKTRTLDLFGVKELAGQSMKSSECPLILQPSLDGLLDGYKVSRKSKNGGLYFGMRQA